MKVEHIVSLVLLLIFFGIGGAARAYDRGLRHGACVELCRPAKFDVDQDVYGGCLCIGSDKVLRRKEPP